MNASPVIINLWLPQIPTNPAQTAMGMGPKEGSYGNQVQVGSLLLLDVCVSQMMFQPMAWGGPPAQSRPHDSE